MAVDKIFNIAEISRRAGIRHHSLVLYAKGATDQIRLDELIKVRNLISKEAEELLNRLETEIKNKAKGR